MACVNIVNSQVEIDNFIRRVRVHQIIIRFYVFSFLASLNYDVLTLKGLVVKEYRTPHIQVTLRERMWSFVEKLFLKRLCLKVTTVSDVEWNPWNLWGLFMSCNFPWIRKRKEQIGDISDPSSSRSCFNC